jgi:4-hydroxy-3-polyprenylbenzoate decarboxylase
MDISIDEVYALADNMCGIEEIGAGPASGTYKTEGMLVVPCSMKTLAGIHSGYADNLLLRAADVTIKEQRPLVLGIRETPFSSIHLRNMMELSMIPRVHIMPLMMTFYHKPKTIEEMAYHTAAKLLEPFGIEAYGYKRWKGMGLNQ